MGHSKPHASEISVVPSEEYNACVAVKSQGGVCYYCTQQREYVVLMSPVQKKTWMFDFKHFTQSVCDIAKYDTAA